MEEGNGRLEDDQKAERWLTAELTSQHHCKCRTNRDQSGMLVIETNNPIPSYHNKYYKGISSFMQSLMLQCVRFAL